MEKIERLLNLTLALLHTTRPLTAEELRVRIDGYPESDVAFHRAFSRDKEDLRELGVPLVVEPVPNTNPPVDGYRIHASDYYLADPGCAPDELAALHFAAQAFRFETDEGIAALWKLGGLEGHGAADELAAVPGDPNLPVLFEAVAERRTGSFTYRGEQRTLDPLRLGFERGHWYVVGFDHDRGEIRHFRLDRIDGPVTAGEPGGFEPRATPPVGATADPWMMGAGDPVRVTIAVDRTQAPWATSHLGESAVVSEGVDGSVRLAVDVTNWPAFRSFVLSFLEHVEVLDPPECRTDVIAWLEAMAS